MIRDGYQIPFTSTPPSSFEKNNASAIRNSDFVESSLKELLADGRIREVSEVPYTVNPLSVSEGEKPRLVLDLRNINPYVVATKFKYEDLRTLAELLQQGDHLATFDLKNGYHHIAIDDAYQEYLGFSWTFKDGRTRYFVFTVLPFGLSSASYAFSKLTRPLTKKWRAAGTRSVMYLDDGIFTSPSFAETRGICDTVRRDLGQAGMDINEEKSRLVPTQKGEWLGICIDTIKMEYTVPQRKIVELLKLLQKATSKKELTPRFVAKIAGKLIAMSIAIGPR